MTGQTLTIRYSCPLCGLLDATVQMGVRAPDEGLEAWMNDVRFVVGADHCVRSPACSATEVKHLKIPMSKRDGARIGDL